MQKNWCLEHSEPLLYVSSKNIGKCQKCVSQEIGLTLLTDVMFQIDEIKNEAINKKKELNSKNIESLKNLVYQISGLKSKQMQDFDKLLVNLEQWIGTLDQGVNNYEAKLSKIDALSLKQYQQELEAIDIKENESHTNCRQTILDRLQTILQESSIIKQFLQMIEYLQFEMPINVDYQQKRQDENDITLNLVCDQHKQKKIIALDITSSNPNVERLGCVYCQHANPQKFTHLEIVSEKWQSYSNERNQKLYDYQCKYTSKIDSIKQEFLKLQEFLNSQIDQINRSLIENLNDIEKSLYEQRIGENTNWQNLTKEQVIKIADALSKKGKFQVEILNGPKEEEAEHQIQRAIIKLKDTLQKTIVKISEIVPTDSDKNSQDIVQHHLSADLQQNQLFSIGYCQIQKQLSQLQIIQIDKIKNTREFQIQDIQSTSYIKTKDDPRLNFSQQQTIQIESLKKIQEYQIKTQSIFYNKQKQESIFKIQQSLALEYYHDKCSLLSITDEDSQLEFNKYKDILENSYSAPIQMVYQEEYCYAIAFNQESSIMVAGQGNKIKVFQFQNGRLIEIQVLSDHTDDVVSFYFMKQSQQFISGSCDATMRVWSLTTDQQYESIQQLMNHQDSIYCMIMNDKEDLLISSSWDKTIKFWKNNSKWECIQTLIGHTGDIQQISLNQAQNTLLSCGEDNQVLISSIRNDSQWEIIQSIQTQDKVLRGSFIDDNVISFQAVCSNIIEIYELKYESKQIQKIKEINLINKSFNSVDYSSQQKYIKEKRILFNKSDQTIYLIKNRNNDFVIEQAYEYPTYNVYGTLTEDGQYLVTWDDSSKLFQVQKTKCQ